jgi:RNA-directed DNA polymerase
LSNLKAAWQRVQANHGAPGSDGMTVEKFAENAEQRLQHLSEDLRAKSYRPQPVRRKLIPKNGGGQRPLGIPTVRDRIVQQALLQVLEPIFEAKFSNRSHGFRRGRGSITALGVVDRAVRHGYSWVVDADIQSFFDTVDHEKLLSAVNEEVADGSVLKLIRHILAAGVCFPDTAEVEPTELGTPQGGPLSPLLANVYLHALDEAITQAGYGLVRYADDFVLFARSQSEATQALHLVQEVLEGEWGLKLHPEKTRVVSVAEGFEFLGFHYYFDPKTGRMLKEVRRKSVQRFRDAIRLRTPRLRGQRKVKPKNINLGSLAKNQRLGEIIRSLNLFLTGWHGYFKQARLRYEPPFGSFDGFIRRRVRLAITGRVGSGWWYSHITNHMLSALGLVSLTELQQKYLQGRLVAPARKG